jgi:cytochrome o ubiquinol oxidase subunit III
MRNPEAVPHESYPDTHHDTYSRTVFGFWIYILTDFILFGTLLATYAVLHKNTFGGPSASDLFHLPFLAIQALILLVSSFTVGLAGASAHRKNKNLTIALFAVTFLLGIAFIGMELADFMRLVHTGNGWQRSAFLSAFFTLLGTHGVHMIFAVLWVVVLIVPVWREGLTPVSIRRLTCLKMFWQFLNIIWVFIFSFLSI